MTDVMTVKEHAAVIARAKDELRHLEQHAGSSRRQLGTGRDLVNRIANTQPEVHLIDLLAELGDLVVDVYGYHPGEWFAPHYGALPMTRNQHEPGEQEEPVEPRREDLLDHIQEQLRRRWAVQPPAHPGRVGPGESDDSEELRRRLKQLDEPGEQHDTD